jgi:hypothetical protein
MKDKSKIFVCLSLIVFFIILNTIVYRNYFATSEVLNLFQIILFSFSLLLNDFKKVKIIKLIITTIIGLIMTVIILWSQRFYGYSLNRLMSLILIINFDLYLLISIKIKINNMNWAMGFLIVNIIAVIFYMNIVNPLPKKDINNILIENIYDYNNIDFTSKIKSINNSFGNYKENVGYYIIHDDKGNRFYVGVTSGLVLKNN